MDPGLWRGFPLLLVRTKRTRCPVHLGFGVSSAVCLRDFIGGWLVVRFWMLSCRVCNCGSFLERLLKPLRVGLGNMCSASEFRCSCNCLCFQTSSAMASVGCFHLFAQYRISSALYLSTCFACGHSCYAPCPCSPRLSCFHHISCIWMFSNNQMLAPRPHLTFIRGTFWPDNARICHGVCCTTADTTASVIWNTLALVNRSRTYGGAGLLFNTIPGVLSSAAKQPNQSCLR